MPERALVLKLPGKRVSSTAKQRKTVDKIRCFESQNSTIQIQIRVPCPSEVHRKTRDYYQERCDEGSLENYIATQERSLREGNRGKLRQFSNI